MNCIHGLGIGHAVLDCLTLAPALIPVVYYLKIKLTKVKCEHVGTANAILQPTDSESNQRAELLESSNHD